MVAQVCNPSYSGGISRRIIVQVQSIREIIDPIKKITKAKEAGVVDQVNICLASASLLGQASVP
jgi:hypothetical protein